MITYQNLSVLSLDFRRLSSNLLNADSANADILLMRFKRFIDRDEFISGLLKRKMDGIEYNFKDCFQIDSSGWHTMSPPVSEECHIKAQYDYLSYICESNRSVEGEAFGYFCSSRKIIDIIQGFLSDAFKPLIDYINDSISKEILLLKEEQTQNLSMVQNIATVNGTVMQGTGTMSTVNTTVVNELGEIINLINRLSKEVDGLDIPGEDKDDVKDDLEVICEQVQSSAPKKNRLQKAVNGIKKFASEVIVKYTVNEAVHVNWSTLVTKVEKLISTLS